MGRTVGQEEQESNRKQRTKLTRQDVEAIRKRDMEGYTRRSSAQHFKVALETISRAIRGDTWRDVEMVKGEEVLREEAEESLKRLLEMQEEEGKKKKEELEGMSDALRERMAGYTGRKIEKIVVPKDPMSWMDEGGE